MLVSLPETAASSSGLVGAGEVYDLSLTDRTAGVWLGSSTTKLIFYPTITTDNPWGADPSIGLASGDLLYGSITYEAAS